jgi:hypothetical protein
MKSIIKTCAGCKTDKDISRIFARFIITCKSIGIETHTVIPEFTNKESAQKFERDLIDKFKNVDIASMRTQLAATRDEFLPKLWVDKGKFKVRDDGDHVIIEYEVPPKRGPPGSKPQKPQKPQKPNEVRMPKKVYEKLQAQCDDKAGAIKHIFCVYTRYSDIVCGGMDAMQWSCSEDIYSILMSEFDCKVELFASPMNCHPNMRVYGSLFNDTDRQFGSFGTYRGIISEGRLTGLMHAFPPAIEAVQNDFIQRALSEMSLENRELGFFCMLAYWKDAEYYTSAIGSKYCRRTVLSSAYRNNSDYADLAEAYFTLYSYIFDKDIPPAKEDHTIIVILANDALWARRGFSEKLDEHFPSNNLVD